MSSHAASLKRMHARLRTRQDEPTFQYAGHDELFACTSNTYSKTTVLEIGGHEVQTDLVLFALKTEFFVMSDQLEEGFTAGAHDMAEHRPYPRVGMKIVFAGRLFRIEMVHDAMAINPDTPLQLVCVSVTK